MTMNQQQDATTELEDKIMKTYYITLDNVVAVQAETEEQARDAAVETLTEILQRDRDVILKVEED